MTGWKRAISVQLRSPFGCVATDLLTIPDAKSNNTKRGAVSITVAIGVFAFCCAATFRRIRSRIRRRAIFSKSTPLRS